MYTHNYFLLLHGDGVPVMRAVFGPLMCYLAG